MAHLNFSMMKHLFRKTVAIAVVMIAIVLSAMSCGKDNTIENTNNNGSPNTPPNTPPANSIFEPTIVILNEEGYVQDGGIVTSGEEFNFGFVMASNAQSGKELAQLNIYIDDEEIIKENLSGTEYTYRGALTLELIRELPSVEIKAVVTDVKGKTASATITLSIEELINVEVKDITWVRRGANSLNAYEMAEYGLQWVGNFKEIFATIKTLDGFSMYLCPGDDFATIKTETDKAAYFTKLLENQVPIDSYRNVSAEAPYQTPNDMLALINGQGDQYLVLFSTATVEYVTNVGTQITINGKTAK